MRKVIFPSSIPLVIVEFNYIVYKINFNNFVVMDVAVTCKYDWKCRFLLLDGCLLRTFSLAVFYFNYKSMKTTGTLLAKKKLK